MTKIASNQTTSSPTKEKAPEPPTKSPLSETTIRNIIASDEDEALADLKKWQFMALPKLKELLDDFNSEDAQYSYDHAKFLEAIIRLKEADAHYDFTVFL